MNVPKRRDNRRGEGCTKTRSRLMTDGANEHLNQEFSTTRHSSHRLGFSLATSQFPSETAEAHNNPIWHKWPCEPRVNPSKFKIFRFISAAANWLATCTEQKRHPGFPRKTWETFPKNWNMSRAGTSEPAGLERRSCFLSCFCCTFLPEE